MCNYYRLRLVFIEFLLCETWFETIISFRNKMLSHLIQGLAGNRH